MAVPFKPRLQKQIQNLSRAINKIDPELPETLMGMRYSIGEVKMGINDFTYTKDGVERKVRYDQIENLDREEQASLSKRLLEDRSVLRQERALEQLQTKGKISEQFKRSIAKDNPAFLDNIREIEAMLEGNTPDIIKDEFSQSQFMTGDEWFKEADSHFQLTKKSGEKNSPELFDFYQPGQAGGFSQLNVFTWNAFKAMKGM